MWKKEKKSLKIYRYARGTHSELDALARQIGEQVGSGGQTGWRHTAVGRVRQLVEAPGSLQAARGTGAGEQAHQKMHAVLLSGANTRCTHTVNTVVGEQGKRNRQQDLRTRLMPGKRELCRRVTQDFTQRLQVGFPLRPAAEKFVEQIHHILEVRERSEGKFGAK